MACNVSFHESNASLVVTERIITSQTVRIRANYCNRFSRIDTGFYRVNLSLGPMFGLQLKKDSQIIQNLNLQSSYLPYLNKTFTNMLTQDSRAYYLCHPQELLLVCLTYLLLEMKNADSLHALLKNQFFRDLR